MPGSRARCVLLALVLLLLPALGHAQPRRLAIFDLANDTGEPALDWVGAALSVSLRERLGALGALELLGPRPASPVSRDHAAAGALEPLLRRARAVGAEQSLLGRYTRAGSRLRVEARVVDVASALTVSVATHDAPESDTAAAFTRIGDAILDAALDALAARSVPGSIEPLTIVRGARPPLAPHEARLAAQPWTLERAATETLGRAVAAFDDGRREDAISDLERVTAGGGAPATVWLLLGAARAQRGDCARAAPALERTLEWSHRQGHVRAEIMSRYRIASCLAEAADDHGAVAALEEIRRRAAAVGYVSVEIWALHAAGVAHERAGRADEALAAWRESARLAERTGDAAQQAGVLPRIATMLYRQAKFGEALVVAGRAAELAEAAEQADDRIAALALMGLAEDAQGRRAQGLTHLLRSAELAEEIGATNLNVERTWLEIARIYLGERQLVEAQVALERAQRQAAHAGSGSEETEAIRLLAWTHAEQNHLPEAASTFQRGLRLAEQRGDEPSTALMLYGLAMVQAASGREVDALVSIDRALEIATRLGLPHRDEIRARREEIRGRIATGKG